ncbi:DUF4209 domain-containing protein [Streptomyces lydicus]|uniref:DUF4209 domain-containing protein n=1 Tax=Streptomyces lydicus TaxID=47763 RepID=UPI000D13E068|nr:DUF4209 domain-containing protein [Streptomyces lydicus]MDC7339220.1 DUF4209 domain-containing protein [Streptomyces lydicus]UEG91270.1 DUF4209 domain-containing protein [Streptomyces lydicus]
MTSRDGQIESIASIIDQAAQASSKFEAARTLRTALLSETPSDVPVEEISDLPIRAALWAFDYRISVELDGNRQRVAVEPRFHGASGETDPPKVAAVAEEVVEVWHALTSKVTSPWGLARLQHLLFERRFGRAHEYAIAAAESYLAAATQWEVGLDRAGLLGIGLRVARSVNSRDQADLIVNQLMSDARQELSGDDHRPGVFMRLMKSILAENNPPSGVDDLLKDAFIAYADPFIRDDILGMQIARASDAEVKKRLWVELVEVWNEAASHSQGIVRAAHLKKALECAEESQDRGLIERAAANLQGLRKDDLGLATFAASTSMDGAEIERLLAPMDGVGNWQQALLGLYQIYGPATGDLALNKARVEQHAREFVLSGCFTKELLGGDGLPRYRPQSDEDRDAVALADHETYNIQIFAPILAMALSRIADVYGIPSESDLAEFFAQAPLTDEDLAHALARAFIRYWMGDAEGAAFTIIPRIETIVRNLVIAMDRGVYRIQRDQKPGQYPGLGYLLDILKAHGLDESWHRCALTVCANPAGGWNIRNEVAHGFIMNMGMPPAAAVLQLAVYLWSLNANPDDAADG